MLEVIPGTSQLLRTIAAPFAADPDWISPNIAAPPSDVLWNTRNNVEAKYIVPHIPLLLTFAFFGANGAQIAGGAIDFTVFVTIRKELYGVEIEEPPMNYKSVVVQPLLTRVGLVTPCPIGWVLRQPMGICISRIMAPAGALKLAVAVSMLVDLSHLFDPK